MAPYMMLAVPYHSKKMALTVAFLFLDIQFALQLRKIIIGLSELCAQPLAHVGRT
jgi:hypothetical protein